VNRQSVATPRAVEENLEIARMYSEVESLNERAEKLFVLQEQPENAIKLLR
jgi:hypothetical protein